MNKVYRVIWNASKCVWQCVSEIVTAKGKSKSHSLTEQKNSILGDNGVVFRQFALAPLAVAILMPSLGYAAQGVTAAYNGASVNYIVSQGTTVGVGDDNFSTGQAFITMNAASESDLGQAIR